MQERSCPIERSRSKNYQRCSSMSVVTAFFLREVLHCMYDTILVRQRIQCSSTVESSYYSATAIKLIPSCIHCGGKDGLLGSDDEYIKDLRSSYALCAPFAELMARKSLSDNHTIPTKRGKPNEWTASCHLIFIQNNKTVDWIPVLAQTVWYPFDTYLCTSSLKKLTYLPKVTSRSSSWTLKLFFLAYVIFDTIQALFFTVHWNDIYCKL